MDNQYVTPDFNIVYFDIQSVITISDFGWEEDEYG